MTGQKAKLIKNIKKKKSCVQEAKINTIAVLTK